MSRLSGLSRSVVLMVSLACLGCEGGSGNQSAPGDEFGQAATRRIAIPEIPEIPWEETRPFNLPLNNPPIVGHAEADFMRAEDTVLGVLLGGSARAYPWFMLANYHTVNDHIDRKPVIVNLCEACNGGAAFLAYAGKDADFTVDFRPCGLKHGTWYAIDFQTGSHWYPFVGEAFEGPLKGTKLERIRVYFSTWEDWVRDHPNTTVVLTNDEVRNRPHGRNMHMAGTHTMKSEILKRITDPTANPKRGLLAGHELVFGLIPRGDAPAKAYTIKQLENATSPIQTRIGDVPVLLVSENRFQVGAYVRKFEDVELELKKKSTRPLLMEDQRGNTWNAWGRTVSGPDHRAELPVADGYLAKWYEWVENFPGTDLVPDGGL